MRPRPDELGRLRQHLAEVARDIARELLRPEPDPTVIEALDARAADLRGAIRELSPPVLADDEYGWGREPIRLE